MYPVKKILVAVDFSDYSLPSLQYAAKLARDLKASMILVNILNERDVKTVQTALASYDVNLYQRHIDEQLANRRTMLSDLVKSADASATVVKEIVRINVPHQGLLRTIEEEKPELLIMGTKGRGALADTILGSCAQKMYRNSPIPMLSFRPAKKNEDK